MAIAFTSSHRFKNYLRNTIIPDSIESGHDGYASDLQEALVWLEAYAERFGELTVDSEHWVVVGARVRLKQEVERFPHFTVAEGKTGVIVHVSDDMIQVAMDDHIEGCEEWANRIIWSDTERELFTEDVRPAIANTVLRATNQGEGA